MNSLDLSLNSAQASFEGSVSCTVTGVVAPMTPSAARSMEFGTFDSSNIGIGYSNSVIIPPVFASEFLYSKSELTAVYTSAASSLLFFIKPSNESSISSVSKIVLNGMNGFSLGNLASATCRMYGVWQTCFRVRVNFFSGFCYNFTIHKTSNHFSHSISSAMRGQRIDQSQSDRVASMRIC